MNDYKSGNFICSLREKKGLTQAELASMLSVTPAAVSKWENGESKPRTDTLFKLAEILNVRAEEIIRGEYIDQNILDEKTVDEIYKRYECLQKVDSAQSISVRFLRLFAWLIDWLICGTPAMISSLFFILLFQSQDADVQGKFNLMLTIILLFPVVFVLWDVLLNGRSVGKRILGLIVLDKQSGESASKKQCFLLDLFFFISGIDAVVLIASGFSVGDRVAGTVVTKKEDRISFSEKTEEEKNNMVNTYQAPRSTKKKKITVICLLITVFVVFSGVTVLAPFVGRRIIETTSEYKAAYDFYINTEAFSSLGVSEEKIRLSSFNISRNGSKGKAEFSFYAGGKKSEVICHYLDGEWIACPQCYNHEECEYSG